MKPAYFRTLTHGRHTFSLQILRRRRKTLGLHVFPGDRPVELRIPLNCSWLEAERFLESRLDWIVQSRQEVALLPTPKPVSFRPGSVHHYLGQALVLSVRAGRGKAWKQGSELIVPVPDPDAESAVRTRVHDFYRTSSLPVFQQRLPLLVARFPEKVTPGNLKVRRMKSRWGSCSEKGDICLNTLLVQKSLPIIDLVINHELCHLKHFGHNHDFYELLDRAQPGWRILEQQLNEMGPRQGELPLF